MKQISSFIILFSFLLCRSVSSAQESMNPAKTTQQVQIGISASPQNFTLAPAYCVYFGLGKSKRFRIGAGLRYNFNLNTDQEYRTSPAHLTSGQEGPQVLFSEDKPENIDTLKVGRASFNSINLGIYLAYLIHPKWEIGFNIDAIGVTFGPGASGEFIDRSGVPGLDEVKAKPFNFNALLVSDNDLGSLNSELYVQHKFSAHWAARTGATFIFSELKTDIKPRLENDRFRHKSLQVMGGISYIF